MLDCVLDRWRGFARLADMKAIRLVAVLGLMMMLASCATLRDMLPQKQAPEAPGESVEAVDPAGAVAAEPEPEPPEPLAPGEVRITIVSDSAMPSFTVTDDGETIGLIEGGGTLQWDRVSGIAELRAEPLRRNDDTVRFVGLFMPGESGLSLDSDDDGTLAFLGGKAAKLSEARRISRLHRRAQRLPLEAAVAYLQERLFAAPAPGRLRSAYADADQRIVSGDKGPVLTWSRFDARGGRTPKTAAGRAHTHRKNMKHAFADFSDADLRLGTTVRVAFRRDPRDIEPARAFFRLGGDGSVSAKLESLLVALMVCSSSK